MTIHNRDTGCESTEQKIVTENIRDVSERTPYVSTSTYLPEEVGRNLDARR